VAWHYGADSNFNSLLGADKLRLIERRTRRATNTGGDAGHCCRRAAVPLLDAGSDAQLLSFT
jgi:hypothetical protein